MFSSRDLMSCMTPKGRNTLWTITDNIYVPLESEFVGGEESVEDEKEKSTKN